MKKNYYLPFFFALSCFCSVSASFASESNEIEMNEKVVNPIGGQGDSHKGPETSIFIYQNAYVFFFGEDYAGCSVSLLLNNVVVFSAVVDENGLVTIPETFIGTYELQLAVGNVIYWAMVEL